MTPYVNIVVVHIALISEEGVGLRNLLPRQERLEALQLALLRRKTPRFKVEVEGVVVHYVLAQSL